MTGEARIGGVLDNESTFRAPGLEDIDAAEGTGRLAVHLLGMTRDAVIRFINGPPATEGVEAHPELELLCDTLKLFPEEPLWLTFRTAVGQWFIAFDDDDICRLALRLGAATTPETHDEWVRVLQHQRVDAPDGIRSLACSGADERGAREITLQLNNGTAADGASLARQP